MRRWTQRRPESRGGRRTRRGATIALAIALLAAAGCGRPAGPWNVLLVTVDTLRADRLHHAGYGRRTSPAVDDLSASGLVFGESYSVAGWTLPSIATVMTGRYPKDHGSTDFRFPVNADLPMLAERLHGAGYTTMAWVSHFMLNERNGFARGFDVFDDSVLEKGNPHEVSTAREITDLAIEAIRAARPPWFAWVHYFDPHFRYLRHPEFAAFGNADGGRYDQEIAYTDLHVGRLLEAIDPERTVVVFTADHGEEFGEHGGRHHHTLHGEVMRTPFVLRAPGIAPGAGRGLVEQIDVVPTLLSLLGLPADEPLPGRNLLDAGTGDGPAFFERDRPPPWRQRGLRSGDLVLWTVEERPIETIPAAGRGSAVPVENVVPGVYMYDLVADPTERNNVYDEGDPRARELLALLTEHFATGREPERRNELDEETRRKLRALGYVE